MIATTEIGLLLEIVATDPSDPVHNIRVVEDQYQQQTSPFHPSFVRDLQNYGVLRFMDWLPTNGNWITIGATARRWIKPIGGIATGFPTRCRLR